MSVAPALAKCSKAQPPRAQSRLQRHSATVHSPRRLSSYVAPAGLPGCAIPRRCQLREWQSASATASLRRKATIVVLRVATRVRPSGHAPLAEYRGSNRGQLMLQQ